VINRSFALLAWLVNVFNPPPLETMTRAQKIGRASLVALTLVIICILTAMLGALGIFLVQKGRHLMGSMIDLLDGLGIIFVSTIVNTICVIVLLEIRRTDRMLVPPTETQAQAGTDRQ